MKNKTLLVILLILIIYLGLRYLGGNIGERSRGIGDQNRKWSHARLRQPIQMQTRDAPSPNQVSLCSGDFFQAS